MPKLPLRIEVVRSSFKHISSMSEKSARDIVALLSQHYSDVIMTNVDKPADLERLIDRKPNLVFAGIYAVRDTSQNNTAVWLTDELEKSGIAYTGSGKLANKLSLNKHLAKQRMTENGIHTAAFMLVGLNDTDEVHEGTLRFPLFVKPNNKSGGQGIDEQSIVYTTEQLQNKVRSIHEQDKADALVEEYLSGREFSIAVINGPDDSIVAMPLELVASKDSNGDRIRSQAVKSSDSEDTNYIDDATERLLVGNFAIEAFRSLGGSGYGRIDVRFNAHGVPHFLESNHIPSLFKVDSAFLRAYEMTFGEDYEAMVLRIVKLALNKEYAPNLLQTAQN